MSNFGPNNVTQSRFLLHYKNVVSWLGQEALPEHAFKRAACINPSLLHVGCSH